MAGTPVGQRTCQTAQRQIGRHAGPLDDAFRPDGGQVGRIRRHHPAEQDGQILLHLAGGQKAPSGRKVDGARILQQAQHRRDQQQAAHGHTQQAFKRQLHKPLHGQAVVAGSELAHKVDGQEHHLPGKEEVVVEQVHRHPEGKQPVALVVHGLVQRPQQVREQRHHIHKVVEEHVVHRKAGQCIQAGTQHGVIPVFDIALQVQVRTAARHAELEHQQWHHQVGQPPLREQQREPEEGRAVQVEGIGVHSAAAQVGRPGKGVVGCPGKGAVRVARPFQETVHVPVKADLLAVEVACIVEKSAVHDVERQEKNGCGERTQHHRPPEPILLLPGQPQLPGHSELFHGTLFLRRRGGSCFFISIPRNAARKKDISSPLPLDKRPPGRYGGEKT